MNQYLKINFFPGFTFNESWNQVEIQNHCLPRLSAVFKYLQTKRQKTIELPWFQALPGLSRVAADPGAMLSAPVSPPLPPAESETALATRAQVGEGCEGMEWW